MPLQEKDVSQAVNRTLCLWINRDTIRGQERHVYELLHDDVCRAVLMVKVNRQSAPPPPHYSMFTGQRHHRTTVIYLA